MGKHILFVDDDQAYLDSVRRILSTHSEWEITLANGVDEALAAVDRESFDVIVSDINMPKRDGFDLLSELQGRENTRKIPFLVVSGMHENEVKSRALDMGATDLLNKPVQYEELVARLNNSLRLKAYQEQLRAQNDILEKRISERTAELEDSRLDIVLRLAKAAEYRDEETGNHIIRVACYARSLAEELDLPREFIEMLFLTSPLHDIGKIGISDEILLKPGRLTADERRIMQTHCSIGAEILLEEPEGLKPYLKWHRNNTVFHSFNNSMLNMAASICMNHHEKWDGSGYPQGLKGQKIPLEARIVVLADIYDALRSSRPYKPSFSKEKTLQIMSEEAVRQYDPQVYQAFLNIVDIFEAIYRQLSDEPLCDMAETE